MNLSRHLARALIAAGLGRRRPAGLGRACGRRGAQRHRHAEHRARRPAVRERLLERVQPAAGGLLPPVHRQPDQRRRRSAPRSTATTATPTARVPDSMFEPVTEGNVAVCQRGALHLRRPDAVHVRCVHQAHAGVRHADPDLASRRPPAAVRWRRERRSPAAAQTARTVRCTAGRSTSASPPKSLGVNYISANDQDGRENFINGLNDFAVTGDPFSCRRAEAAEGEGQDRSRTPRSRRRRWCSPTRSSTRTRPRPSRALRSPT